MTERLTKEREKQIRMDSAAFIKDKNQDALWAEDCQVLLRELDAVRQERDAFERKFDHEFKSVTEVLNHKRLLTIQLATARKTLEGSPHSLECSIFYGRRDVCNCFKSKVLAELDGLQKENG